jgi:tetratricopeptide (TPR) repeat protein
LQVRPRTLLLLVALAAAVSACAAKTIPAPVVTTLRYPDFQMPTVPPVLAGTRAAMAHERAWRFLQAGDLKNAEHEAAAALQASPAFFPAEAATGYIAMARKDPKAALPHFDKSLDRQPGYVPALVGRGQALQALERDEEAIAAFSAALVLDPSLADLPRQIEVLRFRGAEREIAAARQAARSGTVDEARRAYGRAIDMSPDSAFLYRELAAIERQGGDGDAALTHFRKSIELDPGDAASSVQIGEILEGRGDLEGAIQAYGAAMAIEPSERIAARREALTARIELSRLPEEYQAIDGAEQLTRGQLAALIGIRLAGSLETLPATEPGVITDVRGNWAERWIMAVARAGVMEPFANHTFQPRAIVRRVDLAPIAGRLIVKLAPQAQVRAWQTERTPFTDLFPGHLAYPAASTAVASGVMTRTPDGAFQPSLPVTGAEAIAMVERIQRLAAPAAATVGAR